MLTVESDDNPLYYVHSNVADTVDATASNLPDHTFRRLPESTRPSNGDRERYPSRSRPLPADSTSGCTVKPAELVNSVHKGDVRELLFDLPSDSVHAAITSPPYFQQRDYEAANQLGQETTVSAYLDNLVSVIDTTMDVVRNDGLLWLVVDDCYADGQLLGIPQRLHRRLERTGYRLIHHSPWVKMRSRPDPADNRLGQEHEKVLCVAHPTTETPSYDYFFERRDAADPGDVFKTDTGTSSTDHDAVYPTELVEALLEPTVPERVCAKCGTPHIPQYEVTNIRNLPEGRDQADTALQKADKHGLTDDHLWALRAVGLSGTGQAARTQDGAGKNADEIEALATEAREVLGSYAREFANPNKSLTGYEQQCSCTAETESGIVLDPFLGLGTTAVVAKQRERRWAGVELNPEFAERARRRIENTAVGAEEDTKDAQQSLAAFESPETIS